MDSGCPFMAISTALQDQSKDSGPRNRPERTNLSCPFSGRQTSLSSRGTSSGPHSGADESRIRRAGSDGSEDSTTRSRGIDNHRAPQSDNHEPPHQPPLSSLDEARSHPTHPYRGFILPHLLGQEEPLDAIHEEASEVRACEMRARAFVIVSSLLWLRDRHGSGAS